MRIAALRIGIVERMREIRWAFNAYDWMPTPQEWTHASACLSVEESERVHKFVFQKDAKLAMVGRLLIRHCISCCLGIPWNEVILDRTEKGKPYLVNQTEKFLSFNVSHQGCYSVLAASEEHEVGVDIMKIERPANTDIKHFFDLMKRQFTPEEWKTIKRKTTDFGQLSDFYRFWCLKESYVKAVGSGLGTNSALSMRFEVFTDRLQISTATTSSMLYLHGHETDWRFEESLLDDLHIVTVASHGQGKESIDLLKPPLSHKALEEFQILSFDELMSNSIRLRDCSESDWQSFNMKKLKPS